MFVSVLLLGCKSSKPIRTNFSGDFLEQNASNYSSNYSAPIAIPFVQQNRNVPGIIGEQIQIDKRLSPPYFIKTSHGHAKQGRKAIVYFIHASKKGKGLSEVGQETFNSLGIVFFVLALLSFFIILNAAAFAYIFITSILAVLSILFSLIGMGSKESNNNDNRSTGTVFTILSILLLIISKLISTVAQYP